MRGAVARQQQPWCDMEGSWQVHVDPSRTGPDFSDVVSVLRWRAARHPDRLAVTFLEDGETESGRVTYADIDRRIRAIAAALQERGAAGERVLLLHPPGIEFIAAFFACLYAGAVAVPAPPPRSNRAMPRIEAIAADCRPAIILTTEDILAIARGPAEAAPALAGAAWLCTDTIDDGGAGQWRQLELDPDTLAFLQYTSGSTGVPKGVMVSHANLLSNLRMLAVGAAQTDETAMLTWLPMFHDMGLIGCTILPLFLGTQNVVMPPIRFIQRPIRWLKAISRYRPHSSGGPNFAYDLCIYKTTPEERADLDLSSWRVAFNGAEPIRASTIQKFAEVFAEYGFRADAHLPIYGLAEATLWVSCARKWELPVVRAYDAAGLDRHEAVPVAHTDEAARVLVSIGRSALDQEVSIVDPRTRQPCPERRIGEIWVHGSNVARGYWERPDQTAEDFDARLKSNSAGPFLRTGDLGFIDGGELFYTGRIKDLIIVHGRNVHPHDIEFAAEGCHDLLVSAGGAAFEVGVDGEEIIVLVHEVGRHYKKYDLAAVVDAIRVAVWADLEIHLDAIILVKPGTNPKTSSGKIMRHAVRDSFVTDTLPEVWRDVATHAPHTAVDRHPGAEEVAAALFDGEAPDLLTYMQAQVAGALNVPVGRVDIHRPVHTLGLDSLAAARLAHIVESRLGLSLPVTTFLEDRSLEALADDLGRRLPDGRVPVVVEAPDTAPDTAPINGGAATELPLTRGQAALWFQQQLAADSSAYNLTMTLQVHGVVVGEALQRALDALGARHPLLAARLTLRHGEPRLVLNGKTVIPLEHVDLGGRSDTQVVEALYEAARRPFRLLDDPLTRCVLFRLSEDRHVLMLCSHHMICDGWSVNVVLEDLFALYANETDHEGLPPPLSAPYADLLRRQEGELASADGTADLEYWRRRLADSPPETDLPMAKPRPPVQTFSGGTVPITLSPADTTGLRRLAAETGATAFIVLQAVFLVLLSRYLGRTDIPVGTIMAGRWDRGFDRTVGYFVNPVVLRTDFDDTVSFRDLTERVRHTVREAIDHQELPFSVLVEQLNPRRDPSRPPLFQIAFGLTRLNFEADAGFRAEGGPGQGIASDGVAFVPFVLPQLEGQFDLNLEFFETPSRLFAYLSYASDLFDRDTIERLARHYQVLLAAAIADPDAAVAGLPMLTPAESDRIAAWNARSADVPRPETFAGACLHRLIEDQAARTPEAVAVTFMDQELTYRDLDARANQLAHHLVDLGVGADGLVAVIMERSLEMVIALLGVLKAGGAFVTIDPANPPDRVRFMIDDCAAPVLLTLDRLRDGLSTNAVTLCLDSDWPQVAGRPSDSPAVTVSSENLAYVLYTSGSTGVPKGVMTPHEAACNRLRWKQKVLGITAADRILQTIPLSFDPAVWEIFTPLLAGARLVVAPPGILRDPAALVGEMADREITAMSCVPSLLQHMVEVPDLARCGALRHVVCGGEAVSGDLQKRFFAVCGAELQHFYGPTEATIFATHWRCIRGSTETVVPIGRPVSHATVQLLDANMQPVPVGVPGELHIGGEGLARGYLNRPELTAERFVTDPSDPAGGGRLYKTGDLARYRPDGVIEFLGRLDAQVKVRGYRVELGEIEARLMEAPGVRDAAVAARRDGATEPRLIGYVVPRTGAAPDAAELRAFLDRVLPEYMIPAAFMVVDALPQTPSGKVDRNALPAPDEAAAATGRQFTAPRDDLETALSRIWESVLDIKPIGIRDNFFDLGGHSLLALRILGQLEKQLGYKVPPTAIFESPTIEALAQDLRSASASAREGLLVSIQQGQGRTPFFCVAAGHGDVMRFAALAPRMGVDRPFYGLVPPRANGEGRLKLEIADVAQRYVDEIVAVQPQGPYLIAGFSLGGVVAVDVARRLREQGREVASLILLDTIYPTWSIGSLILFRIIKALVTRFGFGTSEVFSRWLRTVFNDQGLEAQLRAMRRHRVRDYPGRITLLMTQGNAPFRFQFFFRWRFRAKGGMETLRVPGWHGRMFRDPYVNDLAAVINDCITGADGAKAPPPRSADAKNSIETEPVADKMVSPPGFRR